VLFISRVVDAAQANNAHARRPMKSYRVVPQRLSAAGDGQRNAASFTGVGSSLKVTVGNLSFERRLESR
jgi:hypothetical protein